MSITFHTRTLDGQVALSAIEPFQFPGGEWHLRVADGECAAFATLTGCTADDLVLLGLWADAVRAAGQQAIARIPYLPAARADRGVPFGARVYAGLINAAALDEVVVFDPHSPVAPELVHRVRVVDSTDAIVDRVLATESLAESLADSPAESADPDSFVAILAPDAGAVARARRVADRAGLPLFTATKSRDFATGKLTGFDVPPLPERGRVLIVDDICDGGGTFMGLAEHSGVDRERLALWVSHGIFSGNAHRLREHYADIWTTDSHPGARRADVGAHVIELAPYLESGRN